MSKILLSECFDNAVVAFKFDRKPKIIGHILNDDGPNKSGFEWLRSHIANLDGSKRDQGISYESFEVIQDSNGAVFFIGRTRSQEGTNQINNRQFLELRFDNKIDLNYSKLIASLLR